MRTWSWLILIGLCARLQGVAAGADATLAEASLLELKGDFQGAAVVLRQVLEKPDLQTTLQRSAEFELDRLERIRKDFPLTADSLFAALAKSVKDLTRAEFEKWVAEGRFDSRVIDGQRRFMSSSISNLFFRYAELNPRRLPKKDSTALDKAQWETAERIRQAAEEQHKPYVLPKRFRAQMNVTLKPGAVPAGQTVRAWLPIPRRYPFQDGFKLLASQPAAVHLDIESSPIRSILLEQSASASNTVFQISYEYETHGVWFNPNPAQVKPADPNDPELKTYLQEAPHVEFTSQMRHLLKIIVGDERNPCQAAKLIYVWISEHVKYSYAIEYSTIRNIGEYCRESGYGDCGQEALLFITLCRLQGIPARWQSGWSTFPGAKTIHDWAEIYLPPYGWMPVDVYMGIYASRYATTLNASQRLRLRDFYFGGLDQYRMIANSDHSQELSPPKTGFRSDTVDFQRGELESGGKNIYFDQFTFDLQIQELANP